ncbi:hypothetical protein N007_16085 [Alicyclobacillus acidoterrestris ATCC 49025]|nr:hypothetical protein N007_16085 [Alicyclobacillus acidoterrestris ATCC 49025]
MICLIRTCRWEPRGARAAAEGDGLGGGAATGAVPKACLAGRIVHVFCLICDIAADSGHLGHEFYLMPGKSAEIGALSSE